MKRLLSLFSLLSSVLSASERLAEEYLVSYGNPEAKIHITQYYSLTCPHCIALFRNQFSTIQDSYIKTGEVFWTLHPCPMDLLTVQAMHCLQNLTSKNKQIFLEAILEEVLIDKPKFSTTFLQKAMELFDSPVPELADKDYIASTAAFLDAFEFLKTRQDLQAVPAVAVNDTFIPGQIPDLLFLETLLGDST